VFENVMSEHTAHHENRSTPLNRDMPHFWCDFNACGWGPEPDDDTFYQFDWNTVGDQFDSMVGTTVILYDIEDETNVIACEAVIERFDLDGRPRSYRARPVLRSWYLGPAPW